MRSGSIAQIQGYLDGDPKHAGFLIDGSVFGGNSGGPAVVRKGTLNSEGQAFSDTMLRGLGPGVMEIAVRYRTDAWLVIHVTEIAGSLWVIHAFQKKSKTRIRTPKSEIDLVKARVSRLRKELVQ